MMIIALSAILISFALGYAIGWLRSSTAETGGRARVSKTSEDDPRTTRDGPIFGAEHRKHMGQRRGR